MMKNEYNNEETPVLFLHGYRSSGQGFKANFLRKKYPEISTPTLEGQIIDRLEQIIPTIKYKSNWTIIGSSYGGLLALILADRYPNQIRKLILLAPALTSQYMTKALRFDRIKIPTIIIHGKKDIDIPIDKVKDFAQNYLRNYRFKEVDDNHRLHKTVKQLDWDQLIYEAL